MAQLTRYVLMHGALLLFALILLEQAGALLASAPILLSVGSYAAFGRIDVAQTLVTAVSTCLVADGFWYSLGRSNRSSFCFLSKATEATSWKKQVLAFVRRRGAQVMLSAKYPFFSNVLSLATGRRGTPLSQFVACDSVAPPVWSGGYIAFGYLLRNQTRGTLARTLVPLALLLSVFAVWSLAALPIRGPGKPGQTHSKPRKGSLALAVALIVLIYPSSFVKRAFQSITDDPGAAASVAQVSPTGGNGTQQTVDSESSPPASQNRAGSSEELRTATVVGTVTGIDDAPISRASITLGTTDSIDIRTVETNDSGFFKIVGIPSGRSYRVTVKASGFEKWESAPIVLEAGEFKILDVSRFAIEEVQTSITVTPEESSEIAMEQVKAEEKQRGLLIIPNFYAAYTPNPEPLTAKLKFSLAFQVARDPFTFGGVTTLAGIDQAVQSPKFVEGVKGYGERLAANYANAFTDAMLDGAILPAFLHQDPRYFYQGTGTKKSRTFHAISSLFVAKGDNGRRQPNYSSIGGDLASSTISNLYYPKASRGAGLVFQGFAIDTAVHFTIRLLDEFVFRPPTITSDSPPWNSNPHL